MKSIVIHSQALKHFRSHDNNVRMAMWATAQHLRIDHLLHDVMTTGFTSAQCHRHDHTLRSFGDLAYDITGENKSYRLAVEVVTTLGPTVALVLSLLQQAHFSAQRNHIPFTVHPNMFTDLGISERTLTRTLSTLKDQGLLFRSGSRRGIKVISVVQFNKDFTDVSKIMKAKPYLPITPKELEATTAEFMSTPATVPVPAKPSKMTDVQKVIHIQGIEACASLLDIQDKVKVIGTPQGIEILLHSEVNTEGEETLEFVPWSDVKSFKLRSLLSERYQELYDVLCA